MSAFATWPAFVILPVFAAMSAFAAMPAMPAMPEQMHGYKAPTQKHPNPVFC
ncbi:MAG: hypothetical protein ACYCZ6_05120 [Polaromonas sp.]